MSHRAVAVVVVALLSTTSGCYERTVNISRAAAVPPPRPTAASSLPMSKDKSFFVGSATVADSGAPEDSDFSSDNGLRIPKLNLQSGLRFRRGDNADIGLIVDYGSPRWSYQLEDDGLGPTDDYYGGGLALNLHTGSDRDRFRVTVSLHALYYLIPYRQTLNSDAFGHSLTPGGSISLTPSYVIARGVRVYAGLTVANQISTLRRDDVDITQTVQPPDPIVMGEIVGTAVAGIDARITPTWRLGAFVHHTRISNDIDFKPTLGVMMSGDFGR